MIHEHVLYCSHLLYFPATRQPRRNRGLAGIDNGPVRRASWEEEKSCEEADGRDDARQLSSASSGAWRLLRVCWTVGRIQRRSGAASITYCGHYSFALVCIDDDDDDDATASEATSLKDIFSGPRIFSLGDDATISPQVHRRRSLGAQSHLFPSGTLLTSIKLTLSLFFRLCRSLGFPFQVLLAH